MERPARASTDVRPAARDRARRGVGLVAGLLSALALGCAHGPTPPAGGARASRPGADVAATVEAVEVLVVPVVLEAGAERATEPLTEALRRGFVGDDPRVVARDLAGADAPDEGCFERASCLRTLGASVGVDYVLTAQVVVLGTAAIVRVRLVDVDADDGDVQRQQTLDGVTDASLADALSSLGDTLGAPLRPEIVPPPEDPRPRRVRIAVPLAAVGAAAIAVGVGLSQRSPQPDVVVVPP